jgi:hypothetical protein
MVAKNGVRICGAIIEELRVVASAPFAWVDAMESIVTSIVESMARACRRRVRMLSRLVQLGRVSAVKKGVT